jgi:lipoprotein-anchoring transpeptidase ErfK/SrfK
MGWGLKRGGWVVVGVGALALVSGSAFAATEYMSRASIESTSPAADAAVPTRTPLIAIDPANASKLENLVVTVDGHEATGLVRRDPSGRLVLAPGRLSEGAHAVTVRFGTRNLFSRTVTRNWRFTVDTTLPRLTVTSPKASTAVNTRRLVMTGVSERGARVSVSSRRSTVSTKAGRGGRWRLAARLPEGTSHLRVVARDAAGNATVASRDVLVDTRPPTLRVLKPGRNTTLKTTDEPLFYGVVGGDNPATVTVGATVNGYRVTPVRGLSDAGSPTVKFTGQQFAMSAGPLPQGRNRVVVWVRDRAGNVDRRRMTVMVDSTDEFGSKNMVRGARGEDVKELQRRLAQHHYYTKRVPSGVYDTRTVNAVVKYQKAHHLRRDGQLGGGTREALVGKIVVTLSAFHVQLIRDGRVVMSFPIAIGQSAFPTPTGNYQVVNKQKDPTWRPPPGSSWAKGLGPIPPGPGNPLGTRWIGTSAPFVGIHGTPADWSVGTRASHGCIRMHIPDVERLYDQVSVGMPVQIRA